MDTSRIALQLFTVRDEAERDFAGTLAQVADIGYRAVEFAGYGGMEAAALRDLLAQQSMVAIAGTAGIEELDAEPLPHVRYAQALGCPYLVIPWLGVERLCTPALPARLNELGRLCQDHGTQLVYHAHDYAFAEENGTRLIDALLANTDPALLGFELDVYWAAYAGVDPVAFIEQHGPRIPLIHLKDMTPDREMTEVGDGTLAIADIIAAGNAAASQWFIVEHDHPASPSLDSARRSLANLLALP